MAAIQKYSETEPLKNSFTVYVRITMKNFSNYEAKNPENLEKPEIF